MRQEVVENCQTFSTLDVFTPHPEKHSGTKHKARYNFDVRLFLDLRKRDPMGLFKPRRKYVVNREVQFDLLMYVGLFVTFVFLSQIVVAYLFINKLQLKADTGELGSMTIVEFIDKFKMIFLLNEVVAVGTCFVLGFYFFNRVTSRIVGPLYNIGRMLKSVRNRPENTVEIRLRKDDYFQDLAKELNVALNRDRSRDRRPPM